MMSLKRYIFLLFFSISFSICFSNIIIKKPYIIPELQCQLGNNLFQVAAASALAWNNDAKVVLHGLDNNCELAKKIFHNYEISNKKYEEIKSEYIHKEDKSWRYFPIIFKSNMKISGYFQSDKYFKNHRDKILKMFSPTKNDSKYIKDKYSWIINNPNSVGIQVRHYCESAHTANFFGQYGYDYFSKAMSFFPKNTLFIVSSNDISFAKKNIPNYPNVFFIENESHITCLFLLSMCKHNIISNSSFGWWAAWLNQNPHKIVIRPKVWFRLKPMPDIDCDNWKQIETVDYAQRKYYKKAVKRKLIKLINNFSFIYKFLFKKLFIKSYQRN
jgi:hypothetical protein